MEKGTKSNEEEEGEMKARKEEGYGDEARRGGG